MIELFGFGKKKIDYKVTNYPSGELGIVVDRQPISMTYRFEKGKLDELLLMGMLADLYPRAKIYIPFLPFAREDKDARPTNTSFGLKAVANLLSSSISGYNAHVLDVHSDTTEKYGFENVLPTSFIKETVKSTKPDLIVFPDEAAMKRYINSSAVEDVPKLYMITTKDKKTGQITSYSLYPQLIGTTESIDVSSYLKKVKSVLVVDDVCDSGSTLIEAAKLLGAKKDIYLYVTHGIFSSGFDELKKYYKTIYTTDSYHKGTVGGYVIVYDSLLP